jgi:hypothetical protein
MIDRLSFCRKEAATHLRFSGRLFAWAEGWVALRSLRGWAGGRLCGFIDAEERYNPPLPASSSQMDLCDLWTILGGWAAL